MPFGFFIRFYIRKTYVFSLHYRDVNGKMHESEQKFSVCKCKTIKLDESYRLVPIVLVLNSHSRKIQIIFLKTIAAAARYSNF